jgi:DNA invertase Pin-like site-specific DNA recombinase
MRKRDSITGLSKNNYMELSILKYDIKRYHSLIEKDESKIDECNQRITDYKQMIDGAESKLYNEIIKIASQTKFFKVFDDTHTDYFYFSYQSISNKWGIVGVKVDDKLNVTTGEHDLIYIMDSEIVSITPNEFFDIAIRTSIVWDSNLLLKECSIYNTIPTNTNTHILDKCVGYCRLSYGGSKNTYQRQQDIIKTRCEKDGYVLNKFFNETLSGLISFNERTEIKNLLEYCKYLNISVLYISEFNRLGRDTDVIMNGIKTLLCNGISKIYVIKENIVINEDFITNSFDVLKWYCTLAEMDRKNINHRIQTGRDCYIKKCKESGIKMGRPLGSKKNTEQYLLQYSKEIELLKQNFSLRCIRDITGTSINTIQKVKHMIKNNE